ncbi:MAG: GNAT family N-acetyltransferase [Betaproteobacteria bacterium]|jgi:ribosomal protein S18 acetylase RimI-like enzyme|nr:GNAT family N-acetyltransferase [Betaproteobacteria bacterium]
MNPETTVDDANLKGHGESTVQIVRVADEDADAVSALAALIWREHYANIISAAQIEFMLQQRYDPAVIRDQLARGVAWDKLLVDGKIVAYVSYFKTDDGREMKLDKLYVHPRNQRSGFGGLLIARALGAARKEGCSALVLAVNKANAKAIAAYTKYGFRIREAMVQDIGGGFVMDDYLMVKDV